MTTNIYSKMQKNFKTKVEMESFLFEMNMMADCIVHLGKEVNLRRKLVKHDKEDLQDIESCRLFALCSFIRKYKSQIEKLCKGIIYQNLDVEQLFEINH